ncbi:MAG TPA: hypothetical protein VG604_04870 [Candidatus Saccharimonadales bacterium]|nr:hypothetical protein [Candidatus Saccharimonadales bacterium]
MKEIIAIGGNEVAWEPRGYADLADDISIDRSEASTLGALIQSGDASINDRGGLEVDGQEVVAPGKFAVSVYDDKIEVFPWKRGEEGKAN